MDFFKNFKATPGNILKMAAIVVVGLLILSVVLSFLSSLLRGGLGFSSSSSLTNIPSIGAPGFSEESYSGSAGRSYNTTDSKSAGLSTRNIAPAPDTSPTTGNDAEDFEITEYRSTIETRDANVVCAAISDLKSRESVIFENANESDDSCNYTFKVENTSVDEVLAVLESFNPRELSENTHTIKRVLDDFTSETEILENKLAAIESTLEDAIVAYDEITTIATQTRDAESLAKIISSKLGIIERLTQERINVISRLERLSRSKAEQLDRLDYTYFYVNVHENKYINGKAIKDSWKREVRSFVFNLNGTMQAMSLGFITYMLFVLQWSLYLLIILIAAKFGWLIVRKIWKA